MNTPTPNASFGDILGALGKRLYTLRNSGLVVNGSTSKHRAGNKGKAGGARVDRRDKRIRKTAEASRRRNRR